MKFKRRYEEHKEEYKKYYQEHKEEHKKRYERKIHLNFINNN